MAAHSSDDGALPRDAIKRGDALAVLRDGPIARAELMAALGVSRTTIHRIVRDLEAKELLVEDRGEFELTAFGRVVADEVTAYRRRLSVAQRLQPLIESIADASIDLDVGQFEDAEVTLTKPTNPYAPVARFMELLRESETLRGFDTTTIAPIYVEEIRNEILGGMETDIVYLPAVVEDMVAAYPDDIAAAIGSGQLSLSKSEDLPFGLAVFDDRVGLGGYDETGLLRVFVDTDAPEVREWALGLYRRYRERATPLDLSSAAE